MDTPAITIRSAARQDLQTILEIYNDAVLNTTASADYEPQSLDQRAKWFDSRQRLGLPIFVAESADRKVAGWAALSPYHTRPGYRFTVENSVYIAADWRG